MLVFFFWPPFYNLTALFPEIFRVSFIRSITHCRRYILRFFCVFFGVLLKHRRGTNRAQVHHATVWGEERVMSEPKLWRQISRVATQTGIYPGTVARLSASVEKYKAQWVGRMFAFCLTWKISAPAVQSSLCCWSFRADLEGRTRWVFLLLGGLFCTLWPCPRLFFLKTYKMETQEAGQHQNCGNSQKLLKEASSKLFKKKI